MKKSLLSLLCLTFTVAGFAACDKLPGGLGGGDSSDDGGKDSGATHVHTYAETWSNDAEGHWYEATCECEDIEIVKIEHVDNNNDGACDICTYAECEHTYSEDWTADCTNHWHAADCGHLVAGSDLAEHKDEDEDGRCDDCAWMLEDIHTHVYATEWSFDETNHWHAALCEHEDEVDGVEAHVINAAGDCTVCGAKVQEVDTTKLGDLLAASMVQNKNIASGTVVYQYVSDGYAYSKQKSFYVLGDGSTYINRVYGYGSEYEEVQQLWLQDLNTVNDEGEALAFGVISYDGGKTIEQASVSIQDMCGYYYAASTLAEGYGIEELLYNLYQLSQVGGDPIIVGELTAESKEASYEAVDNLVITHDADNNAYSMSFNYLLVQVIPQTGDDVQLISFYYSVNASFEYTDNFEITAAEVNVSAYSDGSNVSYDKDYVYDPATGEVEWTAEKGADEYVYSVSQVVGDKNYNTIYPKVELVPTDFDFFTDEANTELVEATASGFAGQEVKFYLGNLKPKTAKTQFFNSDDFVLTCVNADGVESYPWLNTYGDAYVSFTPDAAGVYTLTVTYGNVVKTIEITVAAPAPNDITVHPVFENSGWGSTWLEVDAYTTATQVVLGVGEAYDFVVKVNPNKAAQGYRFAIDNEGATISDVELTGELIIFYEMVESYTAKRFVSETEGVYVVTFASTEDENVTATFTFYVGVEPEPEEQDGIYELVVSSEDYGRSEEAIFNVFESGSYVITAEVPAGVWLQVYNAAEDMWDRIDTNLPYAVNADAGEQIKIRLFTMDASEDVKGSTVVVTVVAGEAPSVSVEESLAGLYENAIGTYSFMFLQNSDTGVYYMNVWNGLWDLYYTYEVVENADGTLTIDPTFAADYWANSGTEDVDGIENMTFIATPNGGSWTFAIEGEEGSGGSGDIAESYEDALEGMYENAVGSYSFMFLQNSDTGVYYMNVWNSLWDLYYTYEVVENADGTLTIDPTFASDYWANTLTEDVDGIADKTFIATPNGGNWTFTIEGEEGGNDTTNDNALLNGTWQYLDVMTGEVFLEFVFADGVITATDYTGGQFNVRESYTYEYNATEGMIVVDGNDTMIFTLGMGGNLVFGFRYNLTKFIEEAPALSLEEALNGVYENAIGTYSFMFLQNSDTGVYYMNVWNGLWDLYYTYEVVENADGTLTIDPTFVADYWANSGTEDVDGIENMTFIATPNGGSWIFSIL